MGKRPDRQRRKAQWRALTLAIGAALTTALSILAGRTGPPGDAWSEWTLSLTSFLTGVFTLMAGLPPPDGKRPLPGDALKGTIADSFSMP
jgi:hypothetical protein